MQVLFVYLAKADYFSEDRNKKDIKHHDLLALSVDKSHFLFKWDENSPCFSLATNEHDSFQYHIFVALASFPLYSIAASVTFLS